MVNVDNKSDKKNIFTILSLTVSLMGHLFALMMFVWANQVNSFFDIGIAFLAVMLVIISSISAFFLAGASSWRSEPRNDLRLIAYIISILSFPLSFLWMPLYGLFF